MRSRADRPVRVCPSCRGELTNRGVEGFICAACRREYPLREGFIRFAEVDEKYEKQEASHWDRGERPWELPFVDAGITWFFSRFLRPGSAVLDVGCGTGIRFVARRAGFTAGIDLAPARLAKAREIYQEVSVASLMEIPYPDSSFDAVISVDVMEHIPADVKDRAIREMLRVLRPGGRMIHVLDLEARKPLHRWAMRDAELYRRYFIDQMGHYGLETATAAIERFRRHGLRILAAEATNRTFLQLPQNYAWQFDNEYREKFWPLRGLVSLSHRIRRSKTLSALYSGFYQLVWTRTFEKLFPQDWSFNLAIAAEKD